MHSAGDRQCLIQETVFKLQSVLKTSKNDAGLLLEEHSSWTHDSVAYE